MYGGGLQLLTQCTHVSWRYTCVVLALPCLGDLRRVVKKFVAALALLLPLGRLEGVPQTSHTWSGGMVSGCRQPLHACCTTPAVLVKPTTRKDPNASPTSKGTEQEVCRCTVDNRLPPRLYTVM